MKFISEITSYHIIPTAVLFLLWRWICDLDGNSTIENNLFEKNDATFGGGRMDWRCFSFTKIINNTIIKNHADLKGGAIYTKSASPTLMNSILWNNHAPEVPRFMLRAELLM